MEASPRVRRLLDRRIAVALLIGSTTSVGAVGLSRAFAATPSTVFHACLQEGRLHDVSMESMPECHDEGRAVSWDQSGPTGPAGPAGAAGTTGAAGPQGAPGISGYQIVSNIQASYPNFTQLVVTCPAGKRAIGGGAEALGNNSILNRTTPTVDGRGWDAVGHQPGLTTVGLHVFAICATVAP